MDASELPFTEGDMIRVDDWVGAAGNRWKPARVGSLNPLKLFFRQGASRLIKPGSLDLRQIHELNRENLFGMDEDKLFEYLRMKRRKPFTKKAWLIHRALELDAELTLDVAEDMKVSELQAKVCETFKRKAVLLKQAQDTFDGKLEATLPKRKKRKRSISKTSRRPAKRRPQKKAKKVKATHSKPPEPLKLSTEEMISIFEELKEGHDQGAISKEVYLLERNDALDHLNRVDITQWVPCFTTLVSKNLIKLDDPEVHIDKKAIIKRIRRSDSKATVKFKMLKDLHAVGIISESNLKEHGEAVFRNGWGKKIRNKARHRYSTDSM